MVDFKIHPLADVQSIKIGSGTTIWQFSVVLSGAEIGKNCNINALTLIENDVVLGDNVTIKSGVQIWDGVRIKNNVFIGPNVTFTNDLKPRSKRRPQEFLKTTIENSASIGANSTILGGISIGKFSMIGAGSLVTKDVPDFGLVYGSPAKLKNYVCECGSKLKDFHCLNCGLSYKMIDSVSGKIEKQRV
jgi:UDP-2-acetamido-3-amino-2,3-dideoxy-glucuronate N-acetyltransferase